MSVYCLRIQVVFLASLYLATGNAAPENKTCSVPMNDTASDDGSPQDERKALVEIHRILNNVNEYDNINRPYSKNATKEEQEQATEIFPKIDVLRVGDVTLDNIFPIDMYFTQRWDEPRLQSVLPGNLSKIRIRGDLIKKLWLPDTIIRNSQESKHPDNYQRDGDDVAVLHRNGAIHYTSRLSAICFCHLDLSDYPFDEQKCRVEFESLNYEENELVYRTNSSNGTLFASMAPNSTLPTHFFLHNETMSECQPTVLEYYGGEKFSSFCIHLHFVRNPLSIIFRSHLPAMLIVLGSFFGFYIHYTEVAGRVALSITCFLAMVALGQLRGAGSQVDCVTAVDIYHLGCLISIFVTLLEFAAVHYYNNCTRNRVNWSWLYTLVQLCKRFFKKCKSVICHSKQSFQPEYHVKFNATYSGNSIQLDENFSLSPRNHGNGPVSIINPAYTKDDQEIEGLESRDVGDILSCPCNHGDGKQDPLNHTSMEDDQDIEGVEDGGVEELLQSPCTYGDEKQDPPDENSEGRRVNCATQTTQTTQSTQTDGDKYSKIDEVFQVVLPVFFLIGNMAYWAVWNDKSVTI